MESLAKSTVIELVDLSCGYDHNILFQDINLQINSGELVCFMGPNGIGKSTLIRTVAGLMKPMTGSIAFHAPLIVREQLVSLVLTDPIRASYMTVYELIVFGRYPYLGWDLRLSNNDRELIETAIEQVHISHLRNRTIGQLSDGQKQMAMIARALAQDTPVMILDEPTAHLDLNNRVEIMRLLRDFAKKMNKAIVLATHELDLALQTADVIWLAGNQKNIVTGIPEDLVLQGAFDEVFRFKGFDLRTGKVQHSVSRETRVKLEGEGHPFLWTKNLLERNGFDVAANGSLEIKIEIRNESPFWITDGTEEFSSLADLLKRIQVRK